MKHSSKLRLGQIIRNYPEEFKSALRSLAEGKSERVDKKMLQEFDVMGIINIKDNKLLVDKKFLLKGLEEKEEDTRTIGEILAQ